MNFQYVSECCDIVNKIHRTLGDILKIEPKTKVDVASNNWQSPIFRVFIFDISISLIQMCSLHCYALKPELQGLFSSIKAK